MKRTCLEKKWAKQRVASKEERELATPAAKEGAVTMRESCGGASRNDHTGKIK